MTNCIKVNLNVCYTFHMSQYYKARRVRGLYEPNNQFPFRISRSKIDLFLNCPRCFYLDRRLGVGQPPGFPFSLNSAVDKLLKKEFDFHRSKGETHPLMENYKIDAVPLAHDLLNRWRDSLRGGIEFLHKETNLLITGGIDDIWINSQEEFIIVDYKATAKDSEVNLDAEWQIGYKRQMEIYQWLFRQNGFKVSSTGYFVYCNGQTDKEAFDAKLEFTIKIIPYIGDDSWVDGVILSLKQVLDQDVVPEASSNCDYCAYNKAINEVIKHNKNSSLPLFL